MDYVRLAATVVRLINKNGRDLVLAKLETEPADPTKPWKGAGEPTIGESTELKGVFVPVTGGGLGLSFISDELLQTAQQVLLVGPGEEDLSRRNVVIDSAVQWRVNWCEVLKPADQTMLYAFGVSR